MEQAVTGFRTKKGTPLNKSLINLWNNLTYNVVDTKGLYFLNKVTE